MKIWKYSIPVTDISVVDMPIDAVILHTDIQDPTGTTIQIWAEVNPDSPNEGRRFVVVGTGYYVPDGTYIGTVLSPIGELVWHLYEVE